MTNALGGYIGVREQGEGLHDANPQVSVRSYRLLRAGIFGVRLVGVVGAVLPLQEAGS
jgi:hypothetical protein